MSDVLPCPRCGGDAIQSADIEWVHPKSNEFRSLYYWHCFDGDCGLEGPKTYDDKNSAELWNQHARLNHGRY